MEKITGTFFHNTIDSVNWASFATGTTVNGLTKLTSLINPYYIPIMNDTDFIRLLNKINSFKRLEQNWDSYNADPISAIAVEIARSLLTYLQIDGELSSGLNINVFPMRDGGIQFEFDSQELTAELEIEREGNMKFIDFDKDGNFNHDEKISDFYKLQELLPELIVNV